MDNIYINKILAGDTSAFRYLIQQYNDMAFTLAMSVLKDAFVAEEVVHDAFIKAFNALPKFRHNSKFSTWFYRIVVNEALKRNKKEETWKRNCFEISENDIQQTVEQLSESQQLEERKHYIQLILKLMSPKESLALQLFYLNEYPIDEITNVTGWSVSNVKVILHRARKNFYTLMKKHIGNEIYQLL